MSFPWCTALQEWFGFPTQLQLLTEDLLLGLAFSTGCRKISALVPEAPLLPPSSLTLVSVGLFTSFSSLSQLIHNILNYIIMEWSPPWIMGSVLSSFGAFQRWLEPAVSNMRQPQASSHRSYSFVILCYQTLAMSAQYNEFNSKRQYNSKTTGFC